MILPGDDSARPTRRSWRPDEPVAASAAPVFTVLSVCTGNICRSPMSEQLLRAALAEVTSPNGGPLFAFTSAGVRTRPGLPMDPVSARFSTQHGGDPAAHSSAVLDEAVVGGADLLLTMTRDHLVDASRRFPSLLLRGFTLLEFARVFPFVLREVPLPSVEDPAARLRAVVRLAAAHRGRAPRGEGDDIEDPIGRSEAVHERVATQISAAVADVSRDLRALARR
ncbi:low molecular weight phosphatase family protein [Rathayibacter rathayi]|uniref:arsenate reductase/protein-tyrosine-phosphatase family protein n=1 Tax=Rathayibacter rathayi TaxID=33887 RepID=UPI000BC7BA52|nr:low molecular weight phosphatase family protein [Rathayibacter rathayi]AZZ49453.1 low molecular weight phosphatase family protein [Rathayibacter rathayi]MWV73560.1 low molecular weight phosphatase family protein [Rathayibacter rathayi NCPPB 2980 = VKM Ac-1601]PPF48525.1 low molecular weight phosphatase family protein [Rathayibacter rathayi]PPG67255.1 low molecular weight phosphatase family protein [Rathayibacter rathayi]PPG78017.1 low molecular weight phosphatase family protein [Rathayibact